MALAFIIVGAALILLAPLLFRPAMPSPPASSVRAAPLRAMPPRALPPAPGAAGAAEAREPKKKAPRIARTANYERVMNDPQGRRELEALQAKGGPRPGDVITLSNGRRLIVV